MPRLTKAQEREIIQEEVAIAIQIVLTGDVPFKYSKEARKVHRCPVCGNKFTKVIWFQIYDDPKCGNRRNGRIRYRYYKTHKHGK
jgi:hypothetical protein